MIKSNFHTHTTFCDGKNTAEEMLRSAIEMGCSELGFSGHGHIPFDPSYNMTPENTVRYRDEIARLKEAYAEKIKVYCGIEQDVFSVPIDAEYDYVLGASHYVEYDGNCVAVDCTAEKQEEQVKYYFGGDWYKYCARYYQLAGEIKKRINCDIVVHFDLLTKFNEGGCRFDENDRRYRHAALEAMEQLAEDRLILEINTGAIRRGCRTTPYPAEFILKEAAYHKIPVVINADAHDVGGILYAFPQAEELARRYGAEIFRSMKEIKDYLK